MAHYKKQLPNPSLDRWVKTKAKYVCVCVCVCVCIIDTV